MSYSLTRFLAKNRSETVKNEETKEWRRVYEMKDPAVEEYEAGQKAMEKRGLSGEG